MMRVISWRSWTNLFIYPRELCFISEPFLIVKRDVDVSLSGVGILFVWTGWVTGMYWLVAQRVGSDVHCISGSRGLLHDNVLDYRYSLHTQAFGSARLPAL